MVAGLFLRNYKTYEKFNFIPFTDGKDEKLNVFIGNNGAGKSSVLEALDTYFNGRTFILTSGARSRDASLTPVFLLNKEKINELINPDQIPFLEQISAFIWDEDLNSLYGSNPSIEDFVEFREQLKRAGKNNDSYLFLLGLELDDKEVSLISIENKAIEKFASYGISESVFKKNLNTLSLFVNSLYRYIYIPVETSITDFLKLEADGMQSLMNKNLKNEIESILVEKKFEVEGRAIRRASTRNISINQFINEKLKEYIESVEFSIQSIDESYHFNKEIRSTNVNPKDFVEVIINTFFTKRRLQKSGKEIAYLSAGERKKALIDIAYSFISQNPETEKEVIIAIDEPESSLHISMCYEQYNRIQQIANVFEKQVFVTTHWYGGLPVLSDGRLYHVLKNSDGIPEIEGFNLENYFEARRHHPDDINLKSFYDLTSSLISSIRNSDDKWLIVEGLADKKYIEHYLPSDHNYRILPVGGCSIVKKMYEYLYLPLSQDEENVSGSGKIYCLIDTDAKAISLSIPSNTKNKMLMMRRLQLDSGEIKLLKLEEGMMNVNTETELEESLNPQKFYTAFSLVIEGDGGTNMTTCDTETIEAVFNSYEFDPESKFSFIKGEETFLKPKGGGRRIGKDMKELHFFFDNNKDKICQEYIKLDIGVRPNWINEIIAFLN